MKAENIKAAEVLESAAFVLMVPGFWTQGEYARDEFANGLSVFDREACSFCAVGAIEAASQLLNAGTGLAVDALAEVTGGMISYFNDARANSGIEVAEKMLLAAEQLRAQS